MKFLILLFFITSSIFATSINDSLLRVHATLVPKLYLMDHAYIEKIKDNSIVIAIIYNQSDYKSALSLKNKIDSKYHQGLKTYHIETQLLLYSDIQNSDANIYYLFPSKSKNIKTAIKKASKNQALTFSYLKDDLKHGVMISLSIGIKVKPILNLDAIKSHNISFRPILLNISNIYAIKQYKPLSYIDNTKMVSV
ncbi:MAG: YfiR/HmsC family protein [Campylobacterota bacterium]|nr:YfiR/HmsC family protein [Campylobacterota bacterium]